MTEPTIDEMLEALNEADIHFMKLCHIQAIRAILEQHREIDEHDSKYAQATLDELDRLSKLHAIRAFVERVEKRVQQADLNGYDDAYAYAVEAELAAIEKDNEANNG
jgi:hypothetical protein